MLDVIVVFFRALSTVFNFHDLFTAFQLDINEREPKWLLITDKEAQ